MVGWHWSLCPSEPPVDVGGRSACAPSAEKVKHCDPSSRMRETGIGNSTEKRSGRNERRAHRAYVFIWFSYSEAARGRGDAGRGYSGVIYRRRRANAALSSGMEIFRVTISSFSGPLLCRSRDCHPDPLLPALPPAPHPHCSGGDSLKPQGTKTPRTEVGSPASAFPRNSRFG